MRSPTMVAVVDLQVILSGMSDDANRACDVRYDNIVCRLAIGTQSEHNQNFIPASGGPGSLS